MIAQAEPAQIPLWLQVLSLAISPIIGFLGVLYGARISAQNEDLRWVRQERMRVYSEFLSVVNNVNQTFGIDLRSAARANNSNLMKNYSNELTSYYRAVEKTNISIDLIGSPSVIKAATMILSRILEQFRVFGIARRSQNFDPVTWDRAVVEMRVAIHNFHQSAAKDLGLSKQDAKRPEMRPLTDDQLRSTHELAEQITHPGAERQT